MFQHEGTSSLFQHEGLSRPDCSCMKGYPGLTVPAWRDIQAWLFLHEGMSRPDCSSMKGCPGLTVPAWRDAQFGMILHPAFRVNWSCGQLVLWKRESVGPVPGSKIMGRLMAPWCPYCPPTSPFAPLLWSWHRTNWLTWAQDQLTTGPTDWSPRDAQFRIFQHEGMSQYAMFNMKGNPRWRGVSRSSSAIKRLLGENRLFQTVTPADALICIFPELSNGIWHVFVPLCQACPLPTWALLSPTAETFDGGPSFPVSCVVLAGKLQVTIFSQSVCS